MPRRARRGFIIFFGHRTLTRSDGSTPAELSCPSCRQTCWIQGRVTQPWFTFFFIPVFPLEPRSRGTRFSQCSGCKACFELSIDQLSRKAGAAQRSDHAAAIQLYNQLRDHPTDSAMLLKLIQMYGAMGEPREARSACRAFPQAFEADPQCAAALSAIENAS